MKYEIDDYASLKSVLEYLNNSLAKKGVSDERKFFSKLVVSELVDNVLRHAKERANLELELSGDSVHIKVYSQTAFFAPETSVLSDVYAESGRGLFLVDSLCEERKNLEDGGVYVRFCIREK